MTTTDLWRQLRGILDTAPQTEDLMLDRVIDCTTTASFNLTRPNMVEVHRSIFVPQANAGLYDLRAYYNEIWC